MSHPHARRENRQTRSTRKTLHDERLNNDVKLDVIPTREEKQMRKSAKVPSVTMCAPRRPGKQRERASLLVTDALQDMDSPAPTAAAAAWMRRTNLVGTVGHYRPDASERRSREERPQRRCLRNVPRCHEGGCASPPQKSGAPLVCPGQHRIS